MTMRTCPRMTEKFTWEEIVDKIMIQCNSKSKGFSDWMLSRKVKKHRYFSAYMYRQCYEIYRRINNESNQKDFFLVVTGQEGVGKSTLAAQICDTVDLDFNIDKVIFGPQEFYGVLSKSKPGWAIQPDEAVSLLFSRKAMSQNNVDVVEVVQKIRRKRCLICICCPNLWVIDSYIRQHRINGLIYIHDSGKFVYFDEDGAKIISELGKNTRSFKGLNYPEGHYFFGSNIPQMPDSVAEKYLEKKDEDLNMLLGRLATSAEGKIDKEYIGVMEAASVLGVSENLVRKEVDEGRIKSIRVGKRILIKANFIEEMGLEGVSRRTLLQKESGPEKKPKLNYNTPIVNVEDGVSFLAEQPQPSTSEGREQ